jgi:hypothetical protein
MILKHTNSTLLIYYGHKFSYLLLTFFHILFVFSFFLAAEHVQPGMEKRKLPDTVDRDEVDDLDDDPTTVCYFIVGGNENGVFELDRAKHILTISNELDRELMQNYTLIVKATEDCLSPPPQMNTTSVSARTTSSKLRKAKNGLNRFRDPLNINNGTSEEFEQEEEPLPESSSLIFDDDATIVRVIVLVQDINDNPPRFAKKIFTGGVSTSADFGTEIMQLRASDADSGVNAKMAFFQIGKIHRTLAEGLDTIKDSSFLIEKDTGSVKLNFDPQKDMKGYFDFTVMVKDKDGFNDTAHVFIYLLREDQRVRFVLRQQSLETRERIDQFRE